MCWLTVKKLLTHSLAHSLTCLHPVQARTQLDATRWWRHLWSAADSSYADRFSELYVGPTSSAPAVLYVYSFMLDCFLLIHRMLDAQSDLRHFAAHRPLHVRPVGLGAQALRNDGDDEQLHQPVHLRRQVPRVPDGRPTPAAQTGRAVSSACGDAGQ